MRKLILIFTFTLVFSLWHIQVKAETVDNESEEITPNCIGPDLCLPDPGGGGETLFPGKTYISTNSYENTSQIYTHEPNTTGEEWSYYFYAPSTGYISIMIYTGNEEHTYPYTTDYKITIYDKNADEVTSKYNDNSLRTYFNHLTVNSGEIYYIHIEQKYELTDYPNTIYAKLTLSDESREDNPTSISPGEAIDNQIYYNGDVDYYEFTSFGGNYDIYTTGSTNVMMNLYEKNTDGSYSFLDYDDNFNGNYIFNTDIRGTLNPGLHYLAGDGSIGTIYQVRIYYPNDSGTGEYTLHLDHIQDNIKPSNKYEINSIPFSDNTAIDYEGDKDYFTLSGTNKYVWIYSDSNLDLYSSILYNDRVIKSVDNFDNNFESEFLKLLSLNSYTDEDFYMLVGLGNENYNLNIHENNNNTGPYSLNITTNIVQNSNIGGLKQFK